MQTFWQDVRYGARMLLKNPGLAAIAVITLALGIGANTAIFSVVNAVLIRAFPYREADRLVILFEKSPRTEKNTISPANFFDWREQNTVFEATAAFIDARVNLTGDGEPQEVSAQVATDNLFSVLGVNALRGRTFTADDSKPGQNNVIVISYGLWQRRFGGDQNIIGRKVIMGAAENTIIGVLPPDFKWHVSQNSQTDQVAEVWMPWAMSNEFRQFRGRFLSAVARLKPGVTLTQASAEMDTIAARLAEQYKQFNSGFGANVVPLRQQLAGEIRRPLLILMGAVGLVLLIACANVANLLLARAAGRQKEIAMRVAMGATRLRIIRQLLTESLLLAAVGGSGGLLLAWWGTKTLVSLSPPELGDFHNVEISATVLAFTGGVALLTGVIFGLVPAFEASNIKLSDTLKKTGRSLAGGARSERLRRALVISEVALALVLLVGAGLLIRSYQKLQAVNAGFNARNVLTMRVSLPGLRYDSDEKIINFFGQALERMQTLPGVETVGGINFTPFVGLGAGTSFEIEGRPKPPPDRRMTTGVSVTDANFFRVLQVPLRRGRLFTDQEVREKRNVVVINEALAKRYFPNEDPLGRRIAISMRPPLVQTEIIGIVGDVKHADLTSEARPMSYWPMAQLPYPTMTFVIRTNADPRFLAGAVRGVIKNLDPEQPVADVRPLETLVGDSIARQRFNTLLLAVFAIVALLLSTLGIYGVMSYSVAQRINEIGIRIALGAQVRDVLKLVFQGGMTNALIGVAIGLAASLALTRVMSSLLFGVTATDALTFTTVPVALIIAALLACYVPARRATKVDPLVALRYE